MKIDYNDLLFYICIATIISTMHYYNESTELAYQLSRIERSEMWNPDVLNDNFYVDGYYRVEQFYCVWVEDRTPNQINRTDYHEMAHHYSWTDPDHFCMNANAS